MHLHLMGCSGLSMSPLPRGTSPLVAFRSSSVHTHPPTRGASSAPCHSSSLCCVAARQSRCQRHTPPSPPPLPHPLVWPRLGLRVSPSSRRNGGASTVRLGCRSGIRGRGGLLVAVPASWRLGMRAMQTPRAVEMAAPPRLSRAPRWTSTTRRPSYRSTRSWTGSGRQREHALAVSPRRPRACRRACRPTLSLPHTLLCWRWSTRVGVAASAAARSCRALRCWWRARPRAARFSSLAVTAHTRRTLPTPRTR